MSDSQWLIEIRLPESVFYAGKYKPGKGKKDRLAIALTKKDAQRFDTAEIAGSVAATFHGRLFRHAYVVEDKENE